MPAPLALPLDADLDILVLGAFAPELAPFEALLGPGLAGRAGGRLVAARATGIGLPMAAAGAATLLAGAPPRAVVVVGTCGAYKDGGLAIGGVAVARSARMVDPSSLAGLSQFPAPMVLTLAAHGPMSRALAVAGTHLANVATTLAITVDDATAAFIARSHDSQVEHLELFGVATACASREIPFAAVLGVANFVGAGAREEWRAHHHAAAAAAGACVVRWLERGGPGA